VDAKNPVSTFLLARYLLELVATVSAIDFGLQNCFDVNLRDWFKRGMGFIALLYRARHSTSDGKFKSMMAERGIPAVLVQPIRISKAIKGLTSRPGFEPAVSAYDSLSNMCHHNGSGHKMLTENMRETDVIVSPSGNAFLLREKVAAVTLGYPASSFASQSLNTNCSRRMVECAFRK
jgi:hypothetical protein